MCACCSPKCLTHRHRLVSGRWRVDNNRITGRIAKMFTHTFNGNGQWSRFPSAKLRRARANILPAFALLPGRLLSHRSAATGKSVSVLSVAPSMHCDVAFHSCVFRSSIFLSFSVSTPRRTNVSEMSSLGCRDGWQGKARAPDRGSGVDNCPIVYETPEKTLGYLPGFLRPHLSDTLCSLS